MPFVTAAGTNTGHKEMTHNTYFVHPVDAHEGTAFFSLQFVTLKLFVASN